MQTNYKNADDFILKIRKNEIILMFVENSKLEKK